MSRVGCALLLSAFLTGHAIAGPLEAVDTDGWHTWRVASAEGAPAWCCIGWKGETSRSRTCNLDSRHVSYGGCHDAGTLNGFAQIYAKVESAKAVKLRVLSPDCPVEADSGVSDLGEVDVDESFNWLRALVRTDSRVSEDALAAIALHRGESPLQFLINAANGATDGEIREAAIFWLGQVRISEASGTIERLMFSDDRPDIRQHAAFVLAQSTSPNRTEALIRQGRQDTDGETRAQAWFWLAQTGAAESEEAILQAIAGDPDHEVREEAVFALSQLPEDRAVDALIGVLEDRRLHREVREQALFWLAQSESDQALAVFERLLADGDL